MITPEEALRWSDHLEAEADRFSEVVVAALRRAIRAGIDDIPGITAQGDPEAEEVAASLDELSHIESRWRTELDTVLEPEMLEFMRAGATEALRQLAIQAPVVPDSLRHPAAESHLQQAANRLVGVGDGLWQNVRDKLVAGLQAGDSIPELTAAVQAELAATEIRARTIARTEVIGASNAGAFIQVQALDEAVRPVSKMWLATPDGRTRVTHRAAGGQVSPLDGNFEVGGASMQYPGDPAGPAREVINCRCTIIWIDSEELLNLDPIVAAHQPGADEEQHTGAMVAATIANPEAWAVDGAEPAEELHITLAYLGEADEIESDARDTLFELVDEMSGDQTPFAASVVGAAQLGQDEPAARVLLIEAGALQAMRDRVLEVLPPTQQQAATQYPHFIPHMTLGYGKPALQQLAELAGESVEVTGVRVALGNDVWDYELQGALHDVQD